MSVTEDTVAKAIAGLDDNLQPVEPPKDEDKKPEEEPKAPAQTEDQPEDPAKAKDPKEDEGFVADELEEPAKEEPKQPEPEAQKLDTSGLNPEERYIVDGLPLIPVRIKSGDTTKVLQVKSWTQLPDDVEFASKRDELGFINAMQAQENRALMLQSQFRQNAQQAETQKFQETENAMIREDVARMQREGVLPKFKVKTNDPSFDKDPATQEIQKVMDFMEDRNKQYYAEYQQGRAFRHIGFEEAYYMYQRQHPKVEEDQKVEDQERRKTTDRTPSRGMSTRELKRPTVPRGTRMEDILNRIEAEW